MIRVMVRMRIFWLVVMILIIGAGYLLLHRSRFPQNISQNASLTNTPLPTQSPSDLPQISIFATGLDVPWAIAFLPDGRLLVTERKGDVRIVDTNGTVESTPAVTLPVNTQPNGEGGLLGIALHPKFSETHWVYMYYTYKVSGTKTLNRVVRMTFENNRLTNEHPILDNIPSALFHNGGRIKFGPDGYLYIVTGDSEAPSLAQDKNALAGKILRITDEGNPAPGNPFGNDVYSYGHRNPEGIAWNSDGQLWETENGPSGPPYGYGNDEINKIEPGKNYGWPIIQGDQTYADMVTPVKNSTPSVTWAPSGAAFVGNSLFFAGLKGQTLYEAVIQNGQIVDFKEHFAKQYGRLREVVVGPDGMLYVTTSNRDGRGTAQAGDDKILRINPQKL